MQTQNAVPLLETHRLTKHFGALVANDQIDLKIFRREVHAVLGENGAGKSTLMKSLYGFHQPSDGEIVLNGTPVQIPTPLAGRRLGIGMVFQNFTLIPAMTVLENIALFIPELNRVLRKREISARIQEVMTRYDLSVNIDAYVADLAMGERQKVEILKILLGGAQVLIFDEPTSVLAPHEVEALFRIFDRLRADDYAIAFITHKLPEVLACADRITVLRQGRVAGQLLQNEATPHRIVSLMLGEEPPVPAKRNTRATRSGEPLLWFQHATLADAHTGIGLKDVSFELYPGEIVGVAGVSGNGQRELGDVLLGLRHLDDGSIILKGQEVTGWPTRRVLDEGVACIPEDPLLMGVIPEMTVSENMVLGLQQAYARWGGLSMNWDAARTQAEKALNSTFVSAAPALDVRANTLSGGNLQRVVIARELSRQAQLLLAYYPARGLDVSNTEAMRQLLLEYRRSGVGILLISEDLDELFAMSDRLLVFYHGQIVGDFAPHETDSYTVGHLMTGG